MTSFPKATQDEEDLEAEAVLHWLSVREAYDPSKGVPIEGYLRSTVHWKLRHLYRAWRGSLRRGAGEVIVPIEADEIEGITGQEGVEERGIERLLLERALAVMTEEEREVCRILAGGATHTQARRSLGIGKTRFYEILSRIREKFSTTGLGGPEKT